MTEYATEAAKLKRPNGYRYRLVSTLDHNGSFHYGHYSSNSYRPVTAGDYSNMSWYQFRDLSVTEIDQSHVVTRNAIGFVFELVEDDSYDLNEEAENLAMWRKKNDFTLEEKNQKLEAIEADYQSG